MVVGPDLQLCLWCTIGAKGSYRVRWRPLAPITLRHTMLIRGPRAMCDTCVLLCLLRKCFNCALGSFRVRCLRGIDAITSTKKTFLVVAAIPLRVFEPDPGEYSRCGRHWDTTQHKVQDLCDVLIFRLVVRIARGGATPVVENTPRCGSCLSCIWY